MKDLIEIAKIISAHGIKGQVKLKTYSKDISIYKNFIDATGKIFTPKKIIISSPVSAIVTFESLIERNAAEALIGTKLFIYANQLPPLVEGEFYYEQLVGLPVIVGKKKIGIVSGIFDFGAGNFCEIQLLTGSLATLHLSGCDIKKDGIFCEQEQLLM